MLPEPKDATYAIIGGTILSVLLMLISVFALFGLLDKRRPAPQRIVTVCSGCGSEWESDGPTKPITTCPNCPLSDEEWERLKKQVRDRKAGGGE